MRIALLSLAAYLACAGEAGAQGYCPTCPQPGGFGYGGPQSFQYGAPQQFAAAPQGSCYGGAFAYGGPGGFGYGAPSGFEGPQFYPQQSYGYPAAPYGYGGPYGYPSPLPSIDLLAVQPGYPYSYGQFRYSYGRRW
jgi:hypothetical protein